METLHVTIIILSGAMGMKYENDNGLPKEEFIERSFNATLELFLLEGNDIEDTLEIRVEISRKEVRW